MKRRNGKTERLLNKAEKLLRQGIPITILNFNEKYVCAEGVNFYDKNVERFREELKLRVKDIKVKEFDKGYLIPLLKESWSNYLKTLPMSKACDEPYENREYYVSTYLQTLNLPFTHEIHTEYVNDRIYKYVGVVDIFNYEEEVVEFLARDL